MAMNSYFALAIVLFVVHVTHSEPTVDYEMDRAWQQRIEETWTELRKMIAIIDEMLQQLEEQQKATNTASP